MVVFITGIDTNIGKTYTTGLLAKFLLKKKFSVITQKIIQTGCTDLSEDIVIHRKIMGIELYKEDIDGITCPYIFKYPASPHLSAKLEGIKIDIDKISETTDILSNKFDFVIIEGIGGLFVPLVKNFTLIDYIKKRNYPLLLTTSGKLGSINHTLMSIESIKSHRLNLLALVYNKRKEENKIIEEDSREVFKEFLKKLNFKNTIVDIPEFNYKKNIPDIDFKEVFGSLLL